MLIKADLEWDERLWVSFRHKKGQPVPTFWRAGKRMSQPPGGGIPAEAAWIAVENRWICFYNGKKWTFEPDRFGRREKTGWMTLVAERKKGGEFKGYKQENPAPEYGDFIKGPAPTTTKGKTLLELLAEDELG